MVVMGGGGGGEREINGRGELITTTVVFQLWDEGKGDVNRKSGEAKMAEMRFPSSVPSAWRKEVMSITDTSSFSTRVEANKWHS